jgi:hypothetical protein
LSHEGRAFRGSLRGEPLDTPVRLSRLLLATILAPSLSTTAGVAVAGAKSPDDQGKALGEAGATKLKPGHFALLIRHRIPADGGICAGGAAIGVEHDVDGELDAGVFLINDPANFETGKDDSYAVTAVKEAWPADLGVPQRGADTRNTMVWIMLLNTFALVPEDQGESSEAGGKEQLLSSGAWRTSAGILFEEPRRDYSFFWRSAGRVSTPSSASSMT